MQDTSTQEQVQKELEKPLPPIRHTLSGDYLASRFAQNRKDWKTAEDYIQRVLNYDPDNPELQRRAMVLAIGSGEVQRGIATARTILQTSPDNALALMFLAAYEIEQQNFEQALEILQKISQGSISDFIGPLLTAWAQAGLGEADTKSLLNNSPLHAYHALLIEDFLGTLENPEDYLPAILSGYTIDIYELEKIADILSRHGKVEDAKKLYGLIQNQEFKSKSLEHKIRALEDGQTHHYFEKDRITSAQQGAAEALFDMARVLFREYSDDSAIIFARLALHLHTSFPDASILLADIYTRNDQKELAIPYYLNVPEASPLHLRAQQRAADLMDQLGRHEAAIALLEHLHTEKNDLDSLILIGDIHRSAENYDQALAIYDQAFESLGDDVPADKWNLFYARGITYERLDNMDLAEKDLLRAIEFQPNNPYILNYLGYSWADHGKNLDRALEMIQKAVALRPRDGYIVDSLGWVYYRLERYEEAVITLERAISLLPYDPTINDHLGDAYWKTGRKAEARFQWKRAINYANEETDLAVIEEKLNNGLPIAEKTQIQQAQTDILQTD